MNFMVLTNNYGGQPKLKMHYFYFLIKAKQLIQLPKYEMVPQVNPFVLSSLAKLFLTQIKIISTYFKQINNLNTSLTYSISLKLFYFNVSIIIDFPEHKYFFFNLGASR